MTNAERAKYIAEHANTCCYRSDGFEDAFEAGVQAARLRAMVRLPRPTEWEEWPI